jgi:hypothetical protein
MKKKERAWKNRLALAKKGIEASFLTSRMKIDRLFKNSKTLVKI